MHVNKLQTYIDAHLLLMNIYLWNEHLPLCWIEDATFGSRRRCSRHDEIHSLRGSINVKKRLILIVDRQVVLLGEILVERLKLGVGELGARMLITTDLKLN